MHATAHEGCTDTVPESALKVDSERKSLAAPGTRTRVSLTPGFSVGLLYPLSFPRSSNQGLFHACESGCIVIVNQSSGLRPVSLSVSLSVCLFLSLSLFPRLNCLIVLIIFVCGIVVFICGVI